MQYNKPPTTITGQINLLKSRGLAIADESLAKHYLQNVGYYRLAGYWWPMQSDKVNHIFKLNSRFEDVVSLYNFDRELRLLIFDVIERIEIALRTKMIYHISHEINAWWFEDSSFFRDARLHNDTLAIIDRELVQCKDIFMKEHYAKYHTDTRRPPAWKTLEVISFGTLSKLYSNLLPAIKAKDLIAIEFNTVNHTYLQTWLLPIAQIRNTCAHHSRLWNRSLPSGPKLLPKPPAKWVINVPQRSEFHKLYVHMCCMKYLLDAISPGHHFAKRLKEILSGHLNVDIHALGMKKGWEQEPLWM